MKIKNIGKAAALALTALAMVHCSDWTETESETIFEHGLTESNKPEAYYEALREWKKTDHSVSFGWYSAWDDPGTSTTGMLMGVPDSMDIISLWSGAYNLTPGKIEDLRFVREKKGTKVVVCSFLQYVGKGCTPPEYDTDEETREAFWGWEDGNDEAIKASLAKFAIAIRDSIEKYDYDGLDIDFEPYVDGAPGKLDENFTYFAWLLDELSKYLGPKSGTGRMLIIDGELWNVPKSTATYFDYFVAQAYSVSGGTPPVGAGTGENNMDSRLSRVISTFAGELTEEEVTNKFIVTENLESAVDCQKGGYYWTTRDGVRQDKEVCPSLVGMARWQPANGFRKGGFGGYRFDGESVNTPSYKWMRTAIQAQNPAMNQF